MGTLPDGSVSGFISGGGTTADFSAGVSCLGGVPGGSINGTITTFTGEGTSTFRFNSSTLFIGGTILSENIEFVEGKFINVTLQRNGTVISTDCEALVTAHKLNSDLWIGSLSVTCPGDTELVVFGIFAGEVSVLQQVLCKPLL